MKKRSCYHNERERASEGYISKCNAKNEGVLSETQLKHGICIAAMRLKNTTNSLQGQCSPAFEHCEMTVYVVVEFMK